MSKKQLFALFVCNLVIMTVARGMAPLLPVYATRLGAAPAAAGYLMSFLFAALTAGSIAGGWLSDKVGRRKELLIIAGLVASPAVWLMSQVTTVWQLAVLAFISWFLSAVAFWCSFH